MKWSVTQQQVDPHQNIEQWALPDSNFDSELDGVVSHHTQAKPPQPRAANGQFAEKPPEPAKPAKPSHPAYLVRMAQALGLSQEEIDSTSTPALEEGLPLLQRQVMDLRERERRLSTLDSQPANGAKNEPPAEPDPLAELGEDFDPRLTGILRKLVDENRQLKAQVGHVSNHIAQKANETRDQWYDRIFDEHGDPDKYGTKAKGLTADELLSRKQIVMAARLAAGGNATEKQVGDLIKPTLEKFGHTRPADAPAPAKKLPTAEDYAQGGLIQPTQRKATAEPKGTRRAERAVVEKLRELDIPLDEAGGIEEAGIPD